MVTGGLTPENRRSRSAGALLAQHASVLSDCRRTHELLAFWYPVPRNRLSAIKPHFHTHLNDPAVAPPIRHWLRIRSKNSGIQIGHHARIMGFSVTA